MIRRNHKTSLALIHFLFIYVEGPILKYSIRSNYVRRFVFLERRIVWKEGSRLSNVALFHVRFNVINLIV